MSSSVSSSAFVVEPSTSVSPSTTTVPDAMASRSLPSKCPVKPEKVVVLLVASSPPGAFPAHVDGHRAAVAGGDCARDARLPPRGRERELGRAGATVVDEAAVAVKAFNIPGDRVVQFWGRRPAGRP